MCVPTIFRCIEAQGLLPAQLLAGVYQFAGGILAI
jgi:hypothetical protein